MSDDKDQGKYLKERDNPSGPPPPRSQTKEAEASQEQRAKEEEHVKTESFLKERDKAETVRNAGKGFANSGASQDGYQEDPGKKDNQSGPALGQNLGGKDKGISR